MKYEIDIDLGLLADEWEPVEFRQIATGDHFVTEVGPVMVEHAILDYAERSCDLRLIVRRRWKWPEWLTAEWYCEDVNGRQFIAEVEPELTEKYWYANGTLKDITGITALPTIGGDWRQSKRRNPKAK